MSENGTEPGANPFRTRMTEDSEGRGGGFRIAGKSEVQLRIRFADPGLMQHAHNYYNIYMFLL